MLVEREVAHNVFLCPGEENQPARIVVWPRESVFGAKDPGAFAMAVCELSGQVNLIPNQLVSSQAAMFSFLIPTRQ